jgi:hypothetical protein
VQPELHSAPLGVVEERWWARAIRVRRSVLLGLLLPPTATVTAAALAVSRAAVRVPVTTRIVALVGRATMRAATSRGATTAGSGVSYEGRRWWWWWCWRGTDDVVEVDLLKKKQRAGLCKSRKWLAQLDVGHHGAELVTEAP